MYKAQKPTPKSEFGSEAHNNTPGGGLIHASRQSELSRVVPESEVGERKLLAEHLAELQSDVQSRKGNAAYAAQTHPRCQRFWMQAR